MKYIMVIVLCVLNLIPCNVQAKDIVIKIDCAEGQTPTLPAMVRVRDEWRQVKWLNTAVETERDEAAKPVGASYSIDGQLLGTTQKVTAKVTVIKDKGILPSAIAHPLPLIDVRLTGDNLLTSNRDRDIERLLSLDMSQQLYNYYDTYGLPTRDMTVSDGWDSPETKLKGHGVGHYLSALALAYAGIDDADRKAKLLARIDSIVSTMAMCQEKTRVWSDSLGRYFEARDVASGDSLMRLCGTWQDFDRYKRDYQHYGYGYINAIPPQHLAMVEAYRPYNNEQWVWAPYYTVHKQLAGLLDVALLVKDPPSLPLGGMSVADKALKIATDMGLWVWNRLHYRTYNKVDGTKEERRAKPGNRYEMWNMYIAGEVGGMQEVLAHLAEVNNDAETSKRLVEAASYFDADAFYKPLSQNIDDIRTRHANQHIPMMIGSLRLYGALTNAFCSKQLDCFASTPYYYNIANNFWNLMQGRYAYCTGGVGNGEMFRQPYMQMTSMLPNPNINETCCAYNLAKLTRDLACYNPNDARYMDYYERLLYNQIVGSLSQQDWAVTYQYAVGLNASKPFGNETPQSSCCGGTGVENHVRYQEVAYYVGGDTLWVNLYLPTEAIWKEKGIKIRMDCEWPAQSAKLHLSSLPTGKGRGEVVVRLRVPYWATKDFSVKVNGTAVAEKYEPCSYVTIPMKQWKETDDIEVMMPYEEHLCYGADLVDGYWVANKMQGPLCMVAENIDSWDKADMKTARNFVPDYAFSDNGTHYLKVSKSEGVDNKQLEMAKTLGAEHKKKLEAVAPLQQRVAQLKKENPSPDAALKERLDYADMVIKYVIDGSGTKDMIKKAMEGLR